MSTWQNWLEIYVKSDGIKLLIFIIELFPYFNENKCSENKEFLEKSHVIIIENKVFKKSHNKSLANYGYYKF